MASNCVQDKLDHSRSIAEYSSAVVHLLRSTNTAQLGVEGKDNGRHVFIVALFPKITNFQLCKYSMESSIWLITIPYIIIRALCFPLQSSLFQFLEMHFIFKQSFSRNKCFHKIKMNLLAKI